MTSVRRGQPVAKFRLTPAIAETRIKEAAKDSANIDWSRHALERMDERGFLDIQVLRALRTGSISGDPTPTNDGGWKCKMIKPITGGRDVGVVTIILVNGRLFIKTVEWEDLK